jgi:hypothetical protein
MVTCCSFGKAKLVAVIFNLRNKAIFVPVAATVDSVVSLCS